MTVLVTAGDRIRADTAGLTGGKEHAVSPIASPSEVFSGFVHSSTGELGSLLAGGFHPEGAPAAVDPALHASTAQPGRTGGVRIGSPAQEVIATAKPLEVARTTGVETAAVVTSTLHKVRQRLRI